MSKILSPSPGVCSGQRACVTGHVGCVSARPGFAVGCHQLPRRCSLSPIFPSPLPGLIARLGPSGCALAMPNTCICQRHRSGAGCSELTSLSMLTRSHTFPTHGLQLPSRACTWAVPPLCLSTRLPQLSQRASRGLGLQTTEAAGPNKSQGETFYRLQDLWCVSPPVPTLRASLPLAPTCVAGRVNPEPARRPRCSQGDKALLLSGFVCFRRPLWVKADILVQLCPIRVSADLDARGEQLGQ